MVKIFEFQWNKSTYLKSISFRDCECINNLKSCVQTTLTAVATIGTGATVTVIFLDTIFNTFNNTFHRLLCFTLYLDNVLTLHHTMLKVLQINYWNSWALRSEKHIVASHYGLFIIMSFRFKIF